MEEVCALRDTSLIYIYEEHSQCYNVYRHWPCWRSTTSPPSSVGASHPLRKWLIGAHQTREDRPNFKEISNIFLFHSRSFFFFGFWKTTSSS